MPYRKRGYLVQIKDSKRIMQEKNEEMRSYKVIKSNELIQKSRFQLSTQEQKIILLLISRIKPDDEDFNYQDFNVGEFCRICGIDSKNGKNYINVKNTIKNLADKSVWVYENGTERLFRWINEVDVLIYSGIIRIKLQGSMKPYLLQLQERFTQYELVHTIAMKSQYSIRMYELFKSHEYRHRCKFDMEELKRLLCAEKYIRFPDFRRKVLEISLREINSLTDITVTYGVIKEGRRYSQIEFEVQTKKSTDERMDAWRNREKAVTPKKKSETKKLSEADS